MQNDSTVQTEQVENPMKHDDELVKCCRCRNKHLVKDRLRKPNKRTLGLMDLVCPCCEAQSYFKVNEDKKNV